MDGIKVWKEKFVIAQVSKPSKEYFASINDGQEITLIVKEKNIKKINAIKTEKNFRLITFTSTLPFELVGFIAKISRALAEEKIPIFVISAYSTDHILVKEEFLDKALAKLKNLNLK